jgi:sodium transport system permease protein
MWQVYFKEILELTRDKKTLIFTVVLPTLIIPIFMLGIGFLAADLISEAEEEVLNFTIVGKDQYPELVQALAQDESIHYVEVDGDIKENIQQEIIRFAVEVPSNTKSILEGNSSVVVRLIYNDASPLSETIYRRIEKYIEELNQEQLSLRLSRLTGLSLKGDQMSDLINPVALEKETTAEVRESTGETIGSIIPYILMLIALSGAMYPAIDIGAGEKERGTLETLLLTPISRFKIVLAKFLVLLTTSFSAVLLSFLSLVFWVGLFASAAFSQFVNIDFGELLFGSGNESMVGFLDIALICFLLIPTSAIFASILLSISIYARTFKEAQNYMSPLMMLLIFPIMIVILPGVELDWFWASIPLTNIALAIKELIKGTIDYNMLVVIFSSTAIFAGALLTFCSWWFQREQVLFRS